MTQIYIGFGINLGDREKQLRDAWEHVARVVHITRTSAVYETEPWGVTAQPRYLNLVVEAETNLSAKELLGALQTIEHEMGRIRGMRYGPRIIDLDILLYGDENIKADDLEIPHPRLAERRFVLLPLAELTPNLQHPRLHLSILELLHRLPDKGGEQLHPTERA